MIQFEMVPPKIQVTQTASGPPQGDREEAPKPGGIQEKPGVISTLPKGKPKAPPVEKLRKTTSSRAAAGRRDQAGRPGRVVDGLPRSTADAVSSMPMIEEAQVASTTSGEEGTAETSVSEGPGVAEWIGSSGDCRRHWRPRFSGWNRNRRHWIFTRAAGPRADFAGDARL
ncbi:MAG: hypothetical protein MPW15_20535 [Candidatus Manganitrophus sp.]|nr:hypothetical protein [Candidatus Manganitrophus sp.]